MQVGNSYLWSLSPLDGGILWPFPNRLKGVVLISARDVKASVNELKRCAKESWPLAVFVYAPYQFPLDHPDLEPVWQARRL